MRNVIFDLDGTLVDSVPGIQWSAEKAMKACGHARACPDLAPLIGPTIRDILMVAAAGAIEPAELDRLEQAFRGAYDTDGWQRTRCYPGVRQMLDKLRAAGKVLSIVTNKPAHATQLILPGLEIAGYFRDVVCRDSAVGALGSKAVFGSKAEMLADLVSRRKMAREESILVGDTLEDCQAAAAAGIACAVVPHGYGRGMEGKLPGNGRRIAGWDELVEWCIGTWVTKATSQ
jgi:phosphoglycolate phosphatase